MGIRKSQMFGSDCLLDASSSTSFDASLVTWFTPLFICCKRYIALYNKSSASAEVADRNVTWYVL